MVRRAAVDDRLSETVVNAVADAKGVDPMALDERLYDVVDPDGLERLFRHTADGPRTDGNVSFTLAGCSVVVHSSGRVVAVPEE